MAMTATMTTHPNAERRKRLGVGQKEFAALVGVSFDALVSWELGRRPRRRPENDQKWNAVLAELELQALWKRAWERWDADNRRADDEAWKVLLGPNYATHTSSDDERWALVVAKQEAEMARRYRASDGGGDYPARPELGVRKGGWESSRRKEPAKAGEVLELLVASGQARQVAAARG